MADRETKKAPAGLKNLTLSANERTEIARELVAAAGVGHPMHRDFQKEIGNAWLIAINSRTLRRLILTYGGEI